MDSVCPTKEVRPDVHLSEMKCHKDVWGHNSLQYIIRHTHTSETTYKLIIELLVPFLSPEPEEVASLINKQINKFVFIYLFISYRQR